MQDRDADAGVSNYRIILRWQQSLTDIIVYRFLWGKSSLAAPSKVLKRKSIPSPYTFRQIERVFVKSKKEEGRSKSHRRILQNG